MFVGQFKGFPGRGSRDSLRFQGFSSAAAVAAVWEPSEGAAKELMGFLEALAERTTPPEEVFADEAGLPVKTSTAEVTSHKKEEDRGGILTTDDAPRIADGPAWRSRASLLLPAWRRSQRESQLPGASTPTR